MARKKSRIPKFAKTTNKNVPCRRSSLQVNLSFVSNLEDSGNGSLREIQPEPEDTGQVKNSAPIQRKLANIEENGDLSLISDKEQAQNLSCRLLKEVILSKTSKFFEQGSELAVKTTRVLKDERPALKELNNDTKSTGVGKRIPRLSPGKRTLARNKNIPEVPVKRLGSESFILSGSNKSHKIVKKTKEKILKVSLTRIGDQGGELSSESSQSTCVSDDIGAPITCSSFISGYGDREVFSASQQAESSKYTETEIPRVPRPNNTSQSSYSCLTPMEITTIPGSVPSTSKKNFSLKLLRSSKAKIPEMSIRNTEVPMELTTIESHIVERDFVESERTQQSSMNVNTSVGTELSKTPEKKSSLEDSTNSEASKKSRSDCVAQVSLKVNTSLGTEESPVQEKTKSNSDGVVEISETEVAKSIDKSERTKSIDKSELTKSIDKAEITKNIDKLETPRNSPARTDSDNLSLIARLRDMSARKWRESSERSSSMSDKNKFFGKRRSSLGEGPSFIEGTPFPPSRSILWKTQIRSETIRMRNKTAKKIYGSRISERKPEDSSDSDSSVGTEYRTPPLSNTIVRKNSSRRIPRVPENSQFIPDSSDDEDEENEPTSILTTNVTQRNAAPKKKLIMNIPRPGRKKLLSFHQDLMPISLTPGSPLYSSPNHPIIKKSRRKLQKRKAPRNTAKRDDDECQPSCSIFPRTQTQKDKLKGRKPRKVMSKKIVVKKIADENMLRKMEGLVRRSLSGESTNERRSSTNEFLTKKIPVMRRHAKTSKLVIVATGFCKGDVDLVKGVIKELGGAEINPTVTRRTTHVVSTGVRTINLLRGIIRGAWLVSLEWVLKSLENGAWLNAEEYEMVHFSKAVQENRRDRQLFGKAYIPELFTTCGPIYIERGTTPPPEILKELIKTAGGRISENFKDASLTIGSEGLREIWVLDSITTGELQPIAEYQIK